MENASKALLMAGELLIGIIVLSLLAYTFQRVYTFAEAYQEKTEQQKIIVFNAQYTKYATATGYEPTYIYAEDVVTLTEQVLNWNKRTDIESQKIELYILDKNGGNIYSTQTAIPEFNRADFLDEYKLRGDPTQALIKEYKFSCKVELSNTSGRVNRIIIQIQGERDN